MEFLHAVGIPRKFSLQVSHGDGRRRKGNTSSASTGSSRSSLTGDQCTSTRGRARVDFRENWGKWTFSSELWCSTLFKVCPVLFTVFLCVCVRNAKSTVKNSWRSKRCKLFCFRKQWLKYVLSSLFLGSKILRVCWKLEIVTNKRHRYWLWFRSTWSTRRQKPENMSQIQSVRFSLNCLWCFVTLKNIIRLATDYL